MIEPIVSISGDYAVVECGKNSFYYGYEHSICLCCGEKSHGMCNNCDDPEMEWCFVANIRSLANPQEVIIPQSKLGNSNKFDVTSSLMAGMAILLGEYGPKI